MSITCWGGRSCQKTVVFYAIGVSIMMFMKFLLLLFCVLVFSGCGAAFDYAVISGGVEHEQERMFLESLFADNEEIAALKLKLIDDGGSGVKPNVFIDIFSYWEKDAPFGDTLVSRKAFVPRGNPLNGRTNTGFAVCINGYETIVRPEEIAPPFTALRVDGFALGDAGYPLVRAAGIRIRLAEDRKPSGKLIEKMESLSAVLESVDKPLALPVPEPLWIASGGDLMLGRGASEILLEEGAAGIFGKTANMLAEADLSLVNLEGVLSDGGEKIAKSFNFRFVPETAPALRDAGIDAVLHANNHVYDYGGTAFLDSLSRLGKAGIGVPGAGNNDEAAAAPFVCRLGDENVRVFGIASFPRERNGWDGLSAAAAPNRPGMNHAGSGGAEKLKANMSADADTSFDIILFHGGAEWSTMPDASTRELYTGLVKAGADLVIGTHPHIVQGFEWVEGKPVFWSLGNYVFSGMEDTGGGDEGLFLRLGFLNGRLLYLEPFALTLNRARTEIAAPEKLSTFYARSKELRDRENISSQLLDPPPV